MVPGNNTDVSRNGALYHVQTEDLGEKNPVILTLVYEGGAVVCREKLDYGQMLGADASVPEIKALMDARHQHFVRCVAAGDITRHAGIQAEPLAPPPPGLVLEPTAPSTAKTVDALIEEYLRTRRRTGPS
jgi:hypothetical protein